MSKLQSCATTSIASVFAYRRCTVGVGNKNRFARTEGVLEPVFIPCVRDGSILAYKNKRPTRDRRTRLLRLKLFIVVRSSPHCCYEEQQKYLGAVVTLMSRGGW